MDLTHTLVTIAFVLLTLVAGRMWWQGRSAASGWMLAMFAVVAYASVVSLVLPDQRTGAAAVFDRLIPLAVVAFPYLLFRFGACFEPVSRRMELVAGAVVGPMLVVTLAVSHPPVGVEWPPWYTLYVAAGVAMTIGLSGVVVWRLVRSARRQAAVARNRMWTLAAAAALLNTAAVFAALSKQAPAVHTSSRGFSLASAALFLVAFTPPRFLRALWRRSDERAFWGAEKGLMAATTRDDVLSGMLPRISGLLGGEGAVFVARGRVEKAVHVDEERLRTLRPQVAAARPSNDEPAFAQGMVVLQLRGGRLGVVTTPYTPMFGRDDVELLQRMGTLLDLALSRAELHSRERQARTRAEASTRDLEALVYGISHDLRAPVTSAMGYIDCLREDYADRLDEDGRHFLTRLRANAEYMNHLISDLLELSRAGRVDHDTESVDLNDLVWEIAEEKLEEYPRAHIEVGALPVVRIDAAQARQLFTNLVTNALVHGGRPDVTVRVMAVEASSRAGRVRLDVADDGRGIAPGERERAFELFERVGGKDDERPGTGIGLAISRKIVEQAGGDIWIADSEGGTRVCVELPSAGEVAPVEPSRSDEAPATPSPGGDGAPS